MNEWMRKKSLIQAFWLMLIMMERERNSFISTDYNQHRSNDDDDDTHPGNAIFISIAKVICVCKLEIWKKTHLDSDYEWQWQWEFLFEKWKKQTFKLQHHENQVLMVLEPHFFQWKWNEKITKNYSTRTMCLLTLFDLSQLAMNHSAIIIFDDFCRAPIFPNGVIIIVINYWLVWQV